METIYVTTASRPTQLVKAGDGPTLLFNNDETNQLLLCNDIGLNILNQDSTSILEPLGSLVVMGTKDVYAQPIISGKTVQVFIVPDGIYYNPSPTQIAAQINALGLATLSEQINQNTAIPGQIAVTGTPLLHGYNNLQTATVLNMTAAGNAFSGAEFAKTGYEIGILASMATSAATVSMLKVNFLWQDDHGNTVGEENWYIPASSTGQVLTVGKGPTKGPHLAIEISNLDPLVAASVTLTLLESTHHIARDDWRSSLSNAIPDNVIAAGAWPVAPTDPFGFVLASDTIVAAPANTSFHFLLPLYCGQAQVYFSQSVAQAMTQSPFMQAFDPSISTNPTNGPTVLSTPAFATKQAGPFVANLPRSPCWFGFTTGAAISNVSFSIIALELTS
jgi:hypothetical protein